MRERIKGETSQATKYNAQRKDWNNQMEKKKSNEREQYETPGSQ